MFLLVLLVSIVLTYMIPEIYASTVRIHVEKDLPDVQISSGLSSTTDYYDPYFIQTEMEIMQSQLVLGKVVTQLDLNEKWGKKYFDGETLKTSETIEILKGRLQVIPVRNTKIIAISSFSDDGKEAAAVANAMAKAYGDYRNEYLQKRNQCTLDTMQEAYQEEAKEIQQAQDDVDQLSVPVRTGNEPSAGASPEANLPQQKKWKLEQLRDAHRLLFAKIEAEKLQLEIPKFLVQITDVAEPGRAPIKPNKVVNIFWGVVIATLVGALLGGVAMLIARPSNAKETVATEDEAAN
jgi:uncharacterized protein involved in exopolysaccharide biosynthesis